MERGFTKTIRTVPGLLRTNLGTYFINNTFGCKPILRLRCAGGYIIIVRLGHEAKSQLSCGKNLQGLGDF